MPVTAAITYDLTVFGAKNVGGVFFSAKEAEEKSLEIIRDTEASVVEVWQIEHKHYCGVTSIACTCKGLSKALAAHFTQDDRHRVPARPGAPLFATGTPTRGRLSVLAERLGC
jgi:hypothetical protein